MGCENVKLFLRKPLDRFLREIWLECCGHMSAFRQEGHQLEMGRKIRDIFIPGMELTHEYDFGDTTKLSIKVLSESEGPMKKKPIEILARNEPLEIQCDEYGQALAVEICSECQWDGEGWLCESCAEEMRLPVVNSPRAGLCGYT